MGIAFVHDLGSKSDPFQKLPAAYVGGFGSNLSYLFSTSVWMRFAKERRTLGMPTEDLSTRLLLTLGDHPFLCAVLVSICFYFTAIAVQTLRQRSRIG
jgi:hypothetical protein